jgi:putative IMPACT (imprinted ancient) family translation regulator
MCLREAEKVPLLETVSATLTCTFSDAALVYAKLTALPQVQVIQQDFTASGSKLMISVEQTAADTVANLVSDLTSGRSSLAWDA